MTAALACILLAQGPDKLTNTQVLAKIRLVPVFLVVGAGDRPVVQPDGSASKVEIFFGLSEAQARAKTSTGSKVAPFSLADVLSLASLGRLDFIPSVSERDKALGLAKASKPELKEFPGVPLFAVASGQNYVTINQGSKPMIPLFFSWDEAEDFRKRAADPGNGSAPKVMASNLDQVMSILRNAPSAQASGIVLIPHKKALEDVKVLEKKPG